MTTPVKLALQEIHGNSCWHVSAGGVSWPSVMLALGEKIPRDRPLRNEAQPAVFRENDPSVSLLIWCSWRVELPKGPMGSSDGGETSERMVKEISGKRVQSCEHFAPGHDLTVTFDDLTVLRVFADHVDAVECSFEQNWELTTPSFEVSAGPGSNIQVRSRGESS